MPVNTTTLSSSGLSAGISETVALMSAAFTCECLELYTDKTADSSLEKEVEQKVLYDIGFNKFQETIQSEDMVQTAYEFTIYEKIRKRGQ